MRTFTLDQSPCGFKMYEKKNITFEPGITVLTGCNGAGKTTLLRMVEKDLKKKNIPVMSVSNLTDGGVQSVGYYLENGQTDIAAMIPGSSEGEIITITLSQYLKAVHHFIETGEDKMHPSDPSALCMALADLAGSKEKLESKIKKTKENRKNSQERWLLLDGCDSGYSIDNMIDLKDVFSVILSEKERMEKDVYIIIAANSYEMAEGQKCLDVMSGTYYTPESYNSYRERILETRKKKDARMYGQGLMTKVTSLYYKP